MDLAGLAYSVEPLACRAVQRRRKSEESSDCITSYLIHCIQIFTLYIYSMIVAEMRGKLVGPLDQFLCLHVSK